jgi:hypothetical protein
MFVSLLFTHIHTVASIPTIFTSIVMVENNLDDGLNRINQFKIMETPEQTHSFEEFFQGYNFEQSGESQSVFRRICHLHLQRRRVSQEKNFQANSKHNQFTIPSLIREIYVFPKRRLNFKRYIPEERALHNSRIENSKF